MPDWKCGLFLDKYPTLDMISFGPTLTGVHSPDERMLIPTVEKFWNICWIFWHMYLPKSNGQISHYKKGDCGRSRKRAAMAIIFLLWASAPSPLHNKSVSEL